MKKPGGRPPGPSSAELRICAVHGEVDFHLYRNGARLRWRCKRCIGEAVTRRHRRVKQILIDEAGGRCATCGYDRCPSALHFHHVDPALKSFPMTVATGRSLDAHRAEAKKCVLVCANCHAEIEAGLMPSPPPGSQFAG